MKIQNIIKWATFSAVLATTPIFSQSTESKVPTLEEVVIMATRTERMSDEIAVSYSKFDSKEFQQKQALNVNQILGEAPGIFVTDGVAIGGSPRIFIRGVSQARSSILVDGIRTNNGIFSEGRLFEIASSLNLEPIEIIRGPQSTLYGSNAIGGVLTMNTKKGSGKPSNKLITELGSHETGFFGIESQGENNGFYYSLHAAYQQSANHRKNNDSKIRSLSFRADYDLNQNTTIGFMTRGAFKNYEYAPTLQQELNGNKSDIYQVDTISASAYLENQTFENWYQKLNLSLYDEYNNDIYSNFSSTYVGDSANYSADWFHQLELSDEVTFSGGTYLERMQGNDNSFEEITANNWSLYSQAEYYPERAPISLTAGIRHDDYEFGGEATTYRLNGSYSFEEIGLRLKLAYGTAFRTPNFFRLFSTASFALGNPNLKNEKSKGWEIGLEQFLLNKKLLVSATYYKNDIENLINFFYTEGFNGTYGNVDEAETEGVELSIQSKFSPKLETELNYTWSESRAKNNSTGLKSRQTGPPRHQFAWIQNYQWTERFNVGGSLSWILDRESSAFENKVDVDDYKLLRVYTNYDMTENLTLKARVENALDEDYTQSQGFGGRQPGRSLEGYLGVDYRF
jgi:vitamin B12 transporter